MKLRDLTMMCALAVALIGIGIWPEQADTQSVPESSKSANKEKRLSGSLVDIGCLVKNLQTLNAKPQQNTGGPGVPHFAASAEPAAQVGGVPGGPQGPAGGTQGPGGQPTPQPGTMNSTPDTSADQARIQQEQKIDDAAKACTATTSAETLGLAMSGGEVVQFDPSGTVKAKEALKQVDVQPGKRIKAKVTGVMADKNTVRVASIDIKSNNKGRRSL